MSFRAFETRTSRRSAVALSALFALACGGSEAGPAPEPSADEPTGDHAEPSATTSPEDEAPDPTAHCDAMRSEATAALDAALESGAACTFDVECVSASRATRCARPCDAAIHPGTLRSLLEARLEAESTCAAFDELGCERAEAECARATPRCSDGRCMMDEGDPPEGAADVPDANRPGQASPPPRPRPGASEQERGARLLRAIVDDDPRLAQDFFFPREAFRRVKGIANPDAYWQQLFERYATDIHALHEQLESEGLESPPPHGDRAHFVSLDIISRGGWVPRGEEANALPYWVSRHSRLRYRVGDDERSLEVRVLITWGDRWYITHLSEFH